MQVAVIPAYNEERAIGTVVLKARQHVEHVIVVDDGSSDATRAVAQWAGAEVVAHECNLGKGRALLTGLRAALATHPAVVVLLDADGQHDPADIPQLLAPLEKDEADVVVGARVLPGSGKPRAHRALGRSVLDAATRNLSGLQVADTQSGYRAFRGAVLEALLPRETGMGVESEMLLQAARRGLRIVEVPIGNHYPRDVQPHMHAARHGLSVLGSLARFVRDERPLLWFGGGGAVLLAVGGYLGYVTASHYYATLEFWPGKALLAMLLIILGSILLVGGLVLDAIQRKLRRWER